MADDAGAVFRDGALYSVRYGDVYAARAGALAQAGAVFLAGCGLPDSWAGRRQFTIAELGFGAGVNLLAVLALWAAKRPPGGHLSFVSVEAHLLDRTLAGQALAPLTKGAPDLALLAHQLLAQWPEQKRGRHRIDFPRLGATVDLLLGDAADVVPGWQGLADAWFLDGFSPARNPAMWGSDLLAEVGRHTAPGGRLATWSVAGAVRAALTTAGFAVSRQPGFAAKKERLEGRFPGRRREAPCPRTAIVGGGIAGAALSRAFRALGAAPEVFSSGPMASANPAALLAPRLATGSAVATALHAQAFLRAVALVGREAPSAVLARGARRRLKPDEAERARLSIASGLFPPNSLRISDGALVLADALVAEPRVLRAVWLPAARAERLPAPARRGDGWWLGDHGPYQCVVLAAGIETAALAGLPLRPVRGQVTMAAVPLPGMAESWGGYVVPTREGLLFGATHQRGDSDPAPRPADDAENLAALLAHRPDLAPLLSGLPLSHAAGVRAGSGDNQPAAGQLQPGLFVLSGLGGRGFTLAPLLAEHVAALALAAPSPLTTAAAALVDPRRLLPHAPARVPPSPPPC